MTCLHVRVVFSITLASWLLPVPAAAQANGRFATLKTQAFDAFQKARYADMAGKLEEVWEQDQTDPKVAEYLAMGYLYGEHSAAKAHPLMQTAISLGGQATFLVHHSHERGTIITGSTMNQFCTGRISITPGKLSFVSDGGEHSATITLADLKDFRIPGNIPGRVLIKAGGKNYTFSVKSESRDESVLLEQMSEQYLKQ
jgi:hypothetical protein